MTYSVSFFLRQFFEMMRIPFALVLVLTLIILCDMILKWRKNMPESKKIQIERLTLGLLVALTIGIFVALAIIILRSIGNDCNVYNYALNATSGIH